MAWTQVPGAQDYAGKFSPTIFALNLVVAFYAATCLEAVANTDYEGQITSHGCEVQIRLTPEMVIHDYVPGQTLIYDEIIPEVVKLEIDRAKSVHFNVDSIHKKQWDQAYEQKAVEDGAQRMKRAIETDFFADVYGDVDSANTGYTAGAVSGAYPLCASDGTPAVFHHDTALDYVTSCAAVLDEQDVPRDTGRFLVLPAWATKQLKLSPLANANEMGDQSSILRKGAVGKIDDFTVYQSNLLPRNSSTTGVHCLFGHKIASTFATQLVQNEELPNPLTYGRVMRSLNVFGWKVVKPAALGHLYIKPS